MLGGRPFKPEEAFHLAAVQLDIRGVQERAQWSGVSPRREVSVTICARDDDFEAASSDLGHMPDYVIKIVESGRLESWMAHVASFLAPAATASAHARPPEN